MSCRTRNALYPFSVRGSVADCRVKPDNDEGVGTGLGRVRQPRRALHALANQIGIRMISS